MIATHNFPGIDRRQCGSHLGFNGERPERATPIYTADPSTGGSFKDYLSIVKGILGMKAGNNPIKPGKK